VGCISLLLPPSPTPTQGRISKASRLWRPEGEVRLGRAWAWAAAGTSARESRGRRQDPRPSATAAFPGPQGSGSPRIRGVSWGSRASPRSADPRRRDPEAAPPRGRGKPARHGCCATAAAGQNSSSGLQSACESPAPPTEPDCALFRLIRASAPTRSPRRTLRSSPTALPASPGIRQAVCKRVTGAPSKSLKWWGSLCSYRQLPLSTKRLNRT
jgi:hypothetical protein